MEEKRMKKKKKRKKKRKERKKEKVRRSFQEGNVGYFVASE